MQAAQPMQLAVRPQIGRICAFSLKVDRVTNGSSEIGETCLKKTRSTKQIGLNAHRKAASAVLALLREFRDKGIGIGRLQDQAIEQDVDRKAALRSLVDQTRNPKPCRPARAQAG